MWTTSNFHADSLVGRSITVSGVLLFAALGFSQELPSQTAPDAPRPARLQAKEPQRATTYEVKRPVELRSVVVGRLTKEKEMERLAGTEFLITAKDPLFIQVKTVPGILGKPSMGAAPLILLNGERLLSTRGSSRDTLVAFLPDRKKIKDTNSVAVMWIGKQEHTRTRKPLTFRRSDIKD
jgi:hypothetical protein